MPHILAFRTSSPELLHQATASSSILSDGVLADSPDCYAFKIILIEALSSKRPISLLSRFKIPGLRPERNSMSCLPVRDYQEPTASKAIPAGQL